MFSVWSLWLGSIGSYKLNLVITMIPSSFHSVFYITKSGCLENKHHHIYMKLEYQPALGHTKHVNHRKIIQLTLLESAELSWLKEPELKHFSFCRL